MKVKNPVEIYSYLSCKLNYIDTVMSPSNQKLWGVVFLNCYENSKQEVTGAK